MVKMILLESIILSLLGGAVGTLGAMALAKVRSLFPAAAGVVEGSLPPSVIL